MKFLLFNMAVATALLFLFTADRGDIQRLKAQINGAAGVIDSFTREALDNNKPSKNKDSEKTVNSLSPSWPPYADNPPVMKEVLDGTEIAVRNDNRSRDTPLEYKPSDLPTLPATNSPRKVAELDKTSPVPGTAIAGKLDPAVAKRRHEIREGITSVDTLGLNECSKLMTAQERRKELFSLAEEMELLYAHSVSQ